MPVSDYNRGQHVAPPVPGYVAAGLVWPDNADLPHIPEPDMTFYSPSVVAGAASTGMRIGPVPSETWNASEGYGQYGPNIFGE